MKFWGSLRNCCEYILLLCLLCTPMFHKHSCLKKHGFGMMPTDWTAVDNPRWLKMWLNRTYIYLIYTFNKASSEIWVYKRGILSAPVKNSNTEQLSQQSESQNTFFQAIFCWPCRVLCKANTQDWPALQSSALSLRVWAKCKTEGNNFHLILVSALNTAHAIYIKQSLDKKNKPRSRV